MIAGSCSFVDERLQKNKNILFFAYNNRIIVLFINKYIIN